MTSKQPDRLNPTDNLPPQAPSRGPMLVLIAGSIAVAALLGWALTRSVEPSLPEPAAPTTAASPMPQTATAVPPPAAPAPGPDPTTGVDRLSPQQLKTMVDRGAVTVIDVRDSVSYTNGHIPGAIHIPFSRVEAEASSLPKDKPIVAYCT
ncbi:MAG TPA: rhodanese-like domain-containing protein [Thermoanaerobaculia bacterium]|nr:rhodanese-like domain-containing protein [Thermoanaerobaculia bacterium]